MIRAKLDLEVDEPHLLAQVLRPDDVGWAECYSREGKLIVEAKSESTGSMLSVLDDYLVNVKVAQSLMELFRR